IAWLTPGLLLAQTATPPTNPQPLQPGQPTQPTQPGQPVQPVQPAVLPQPGTQPAVDPNAVAATVNGVAIPALTLQRELERVPPSKRAEVRPELLNFLNDLQLLEQYLSQSGLNPTQQEVDGRFNDIKAELAKQKRDLSEQLKRDRITEAELKARITTEL